MFKIMAQLHLVEIYGLGYCNINKTLTLQSRFFTYAIKFSPGVLFSNYDRQKIR